MKLFKDIFNLFLLYNFICWEKLDMDGNYFDSLTLVQNMSSYILITFLSNARKWEIRDLRL